ncbi:MAG: 16S rRNA (guanine(966)-N(2))-methyltransferase RsmD [Bifidobacteriaceae bacterium]|nr:16S rRNA (guanine(966)-N(2))-methyltransferase RsmD [Bifidobacteriaceae bacterium]
MTRIVAGVAGGRPIKVPAAGTRPTSERVREGLFSAVEALCGGPTAWEGKRILDLYAGSGSLALEALSRGATSALAIDSSPAAVRVIRANATALGLAQQLQVWRTRVEVALKRGMPGRFDLVFLDPPYDLPTAAVDAVLASLAASGLLAPGAVVAVERSARAAAPGWPEGWEDIGMREYGETAIYLARNGGVGGKDAEGKLRGAKRGHGAARGDGEERDDGIGQDHG